MIKISAYIIITISSMISYCLFWYRSFKINLKIQERTVNNIFEHKVFENQKHLSNISKKPLQYLISFFTLSTVVITLIYSAFYFGLQNIIIEINSKFFFTSILMFFVIISIFLVINFIVFYIMSSIIGFLVLRFNDKKVKKFNKLNNQNLKTYKTIMNEWNISKREASYDMTNYFGYHFSKIIVLGTALTGEFLIWVLPDISTNSDAITWIVLTLAFSVKSILNFKFRKKRINRRNQIEIRKNENIIGEHDE